jgi:hypothetical protein
MLKIKKYEGPPLHINRFCYFAISNSKDEHFNQKQRLQRKTDFNKNIPLLTTPTLSFFFFHFLYENRGKECPSGNSKGNQSICNTY